MDFLAGDALGGRGSGTRDEWIAATYVASQLRQWGIEPLGDAETTCRPSRRLAKNRPGIPARSYGTPSGDSSARTAVDRKR
jgi:hypothetical protein